MLIPCSVAAADVVVGPSTGLLGSGRQLAPAGRMTQLGLFPTGAALTKDGHFAWVVDSGRYTDDVKVVDVGSGAVVQTIAGPGAYGGITFSPDGSRAYVSGEPRAGYASSPTFTGADRGDVIHVFSVNGTTGKGTALGPVTLPATSGGTAQLHASSPFSSRPGPEGSLPLGWPIGLAVTPDGTTLAVALNQADQLALVDLASGTARLVQVGA